MSKLCVFDVTLKADAANASVDKIKSFLRKWCKKWTFQRETGASGYDHYQMRLSMKIRKAMKTAVKMCMAQWGPGFGKITPTSGETAEMMELMGEAFYCQKEDTRTEGPWTDRDDTGYVQMRFRNGVLKQWQQELQQKMNLQLAMGDDRHIILVYNPSGNIGKSWFRGYMKQRHGWLTVPSSCQNPQEMIQYLASNPKVQDGWKGYIMCDVPRAVSPKHWFTLAQGLETIKQGEWYDGRYSMKEKIVEPPAMCVFVNSKPPPEVMSADVFELIEIQ